MKMRRAEGSVREDGRRMKRTRKRGSRRRQKKKIVGQIKKIKKKHTERENEGERTTRETKTYLSQVTEGQKQRVTLEACDRAGSGKTCGKIQTRPPQSTPGEREERRRRKKNKRVKKQNNKGPGRICYASG